MTTSLFSMRRLERRFTRSTREARLEGASSATKSTVSSMSRRHREPCRAFLAATVQQPSSFSPFDCRSASHVLTPKIARSQSFRPPDVVILSWLLERRDRTTKYPHGSDRERTAERDVSGGTCCANAGRV